MTDSFKAGIDYVESTRQRIKNKDGTKKPDPSEIKTLGIPTTSGINPDEDSLQSPVYDQFTIEEDQPI